MIERQLHHEAIEMSHLVFGLIEGPSAVSRRREFIAAGDAAGLSVSVGEMISRPLLTEMTGPIPKGGQLFLLTATAGEDNSDSLVSPYDVSPERAIRGVSAVDQWTKSVLDLEGIDRIRLWTTEGYDDKFQQYTVRPGQLLSILEREMVTNGYLPSTLITIQRNATR
jgi:hypothetical protein